MTERDPYYWHRPRIQTLSKDQVWQQAYVMAATSLHVYNLTHTTGMPWETWDPDEEAARIADEVAERYAKRMLKLGRYT